MKIGTIELTTTSEEFDEVAKQLGKTYTPEDALELVTMLAVSKECNRDVNITHEHRAMIAAGILIGAELYRRRLNDEGKKMMRGFEGMTEADFVEEA
jgi:hypothetical protein